MQSRERELPTKLFSFFRLKELSDFQDSCFKSLICSLPEINNGLVNLFFLPLSTLKLCKDKHLGAMTTGGYDGVAEVFATNLEDESHHLSQIAHAVVVITVMNSFHISGHQSTLKDTVKLGKKLIAAYGLTEVYGGVTEGVWRIDKYESQNPSLTS